MKSLVVYDSLYGNTEKIARVVARAVGEDTKLLPVSKAKKSDLKNIKLLVVGSPTHAGKPKLETRTFLNKIRDKNLAGIKAAAFDTRLKASKLNPFMKILLKTTGYAAPKIATSLQAKGATMVAAPKGFIVKGKEGPLRKGELERAQKWAKSLIKNPDHIKHSLFLH